MPWGVFRPLISPITPVGQAPFPLAVEKTLQLEGGKTLEACVRGWQTLTRRPGCGRPEQGDILAKGRLFALSNASERGREPKEDAVARWSRLTTDYNHAETNEPETRECHL